MAVLAAHGKDVGGGILHRTAQSMDAVRFGFGHRLCAKPQYGGALPEALFVQGSLTAQLYPLARHKFGSFRQRKGIQPTAVTLNHHGIVGELIDRTAERGLRSSGCCARQRCGRGCRFRCPSPAAARQEQEVRKDKKKLFHGFLSFPHRGGIYSKRLLSF